MEFDLQNIWNSEGLAAAALVVGLIFGFIQSAVPAITNSGTLRNWALMALSALVVGLAALDSGATPTIENVVAGVLVFIGLYNATVNLHQAGAATAQKTVGGSQITSAKTLLNPSADPA